MSRSSQRDTRILLGKKKLLPLFGDKSAEMETYMKDNKLGTDVPDLRKAIIHYNELVAGPKKD